MRWLLLLGAEARYADSLDVACEHLATLGELKPLTGTRLTDAADGGGRRYRNRLVSVASDGPRTVLVDACKRIERALGRGTLDGVPLDIDLLACADDNDWCMDAHALAKREFDAPHVRLLLREAGLDAPPAAE